MRKRKIVVKIMVILAAIILITEITIRLTIGYKLQRWSECEFQPDPVLGYRYKSNSAGVVSDAAYSRPYRINSHGFAGEEFSPAREKGIYRIAVVGASDEAGLYTNGPANYISIADSLLKRRGYKVEMLNLAIDGRSRSIRNIEFAKTMYNEYEPDLVLLRFTEWPLEDGVEYRTSYKGVEIRYTDTGQSNLNAAKGYIDNELSNKSLRLYLYDYSYIYRWMVKYYVSNYKTQKNKLWKWFAGLLFVDDNKMKRYTRNQIFWPAYQEFRIVFPEKESMKALDSLRNFLSARHSRLLVLKTYATDYPDADSGLFDRYHIPRLFLGVQKKAEYSFGAEDGHSSQEGHKAIGYALFNALKDSIPQPN